MYNSSIATVRHHHRRQRAGETAPGAPLPPVRVVVAVSDEIVQIKLADEAGGIKRSSLINVWSYRALESSSGWQKWHKQWVTLLASVAAGSLAPC